MVVEVYYTKREVVAYNFALSVHSDHLAGIHYLFGVDNFVDPLAYTQTCYSGMVEEKANDLH